MCLLGKLNLRQSQLEDWFPSSMRHTLTWVLCLPTRDKAPEALRNTASISNRQKSFNSRTRKSHILSEVKSFFRFLLYRAHQSGVYRRCVGFSLQQLILENKLRKDPCCFRMSVSVGGVYQPCHRPSGHPASCNSRIYSTHFRALRKVLHFIDP